MQDKIVTESTICVSVQRSALCSSEQEQRDHRDWLPQPLSEGKAFITADYLNDPFSFKVCCSRTLWIWILISFFCLYQVFTPEGELVMKFGSNGEGNGQFNAPTGVAVDVNGNIIVADWGNSRIQVQNVTTRSTYFGSLCRIRLHFLPLLKHFQVFDGSGSFLSYINTSADPLYGPQGLALTSDGHVVVADSGNHCFKVYRYLQWWRIGGKAVGGSGCWSEGIWCTSSHF